MRRKSKKPIARKIVLRLPDLDHAKSAVLCSLSSPNSRRNYKFAMEQFITWYCSEPRPRAKSHGGPAIPPLSGIARTRGGYHQPKTCRRSSPGL